MAGAGVADPVRVLVATTFNVDTVMAAGRPVADWEFEIAPRAGGCE